MDTCKQEIIIGLMLVLLWKMLFYKSIYFHKVFKHIRPHQQEDLILLDNTLGTLEWIQTREIAQQLLIKLNLGKMGSLGIRNATTLTNDQLQSTSTHESTLHSYKCSDCWIRQENIVLEADGVQNGFVSRNNYGNSKKEME